MNSLIYLLMTLGALIVGVSLYSLRRQKPSLTGSTQEETLHGCRTMLALLASFQQHRGMSSALLSGDKTFRGRLDHKAGEIELLLPQLGKLAKLESAQAFPCLTTHELALFRFNWQGLREKLVGLTVEQSIAQHSLLIAELIKWLAALGEARLESMIASPDMAATVRNYASRLPALTECLGQARALGTSVATRQSCSAVARVRLMFLVARAEALLSQVTASCGKTMDGDAAVQAVQQMVRVVRTQLLLSTGINVGADAYFQIATRAIDSVFVWIEHCGDAVAAELALKGGLRESRPEKTH